MAADHAQTTRTTITQPEPTLYRVTPQESRTSFRILFETDAPAPTLIIPVPDDAIPFQTTSHTYSLAGRQTTAGDWPAHDGTADERVRVEPDGSRDIICLDGVRKKSVCIEYTASPPELVLHTTDAAAADHRIALP